MPQLDVSDVFLDPLFTSLVTVLRRQQVVGDNGITSVITTTFSNVIATVTGRDTNLDRQTDQQTVTNEVLVITRFALQGPVQVQGTNFQPDIVVWQGSNFVAKSLNTWSQWGVGFVEVVCASMDIQDPSS